MTSSFFDTVWYWTGGRQYGKWNPTLGYSQQMIADIERGGRVALPGKLSIGPPEGPPSEAQFRAVGM